MTNRAGEVLAIEPGAELPALAGGKALGLLALRAAGLSVPAAWVILPGAAPASIAALARGLAARGIAELAVRSSAHDEDGRLHSFAGIHDTLLGVPTSELAGAVAKVASSALSERAVSYRRQHGLPRAPGACAVVVQQLVDAEWAGTAFGRNGAVVVEAVEGLGESCVDGSATPETIELEKGSTAWRVARRWPRRQPTARRVARSGIESGALAGERPDLPEWIASTLAGAVASLEHARGVPLEIEWAARGATVWFLQARPQTRPLVSGLPPGEVWTRTNVRELVPEVVSAFGASVVLKPFDTYFRAFHRAMGVPLPADVPVMTTVAGRAVASERMFCAIGDAMGVPRAWMQVLQGGVGDAVNAPPPIDVRRVVRRLDLVFRLNAFGMGAERKARRYLATLRARTAARAAVPTAAMADAELLARVRRITNEDVVQALDHVNRVAFAFNNGVMAAAMVLRGDPAPTALVARLVDPSLVSVTTRQLEDLVELARSMRQWEGARSFLETIRPEHASRDHWRSALPPARWEDVARWLDAYGHRGAFESELALPRTAEDLRQLASALRPFVLEPREPELGESRRARRRRDCEVAWAEVTRTHGRLGRMRLSGPVRKVGRFMFLREELRAEWMREWELARRYLLELGRRLVARGALDAVEDLFHLTHEEVERLLQDPSFDARSAVARQRARIAAWRRVEVPNRFTTEEAANLSGRAPTQDPGSVFRGTAVSPGEAVGRACLLRSPLDEGRMRRGGILVAPATDPGWTPLFARAAAVVVELGGVMSHAATVAREYGLPCVSNVLGAMDRVRDGDLVRVDGNHGIVEILERPAADPPGR
jgi:pyruvate,water dikinase